MKNKKMLSTVVASALVATTMSMPAMAADEGGFDVNVTTKTPVIRVVVPTSMEIAVNQFEMGDGGSQIYSNAFEMENKSEIPVKMLVTSTATVPDTTKLLATKKEAEDSVKDGEAWLAAAAQVDANKYESGATDSTTKNLTEASPNVATFDGTEKKTSQTFYLDQSSPMAYKILTDGDNVAKVEGFTQFYELTAITGLGSGGEVDILNGELENEDLYTVTTTGLADGDTLDKIEKGDTVSSYDNTKTYYKAAMTTSTPASTKPYLYGEGTTATAGKAAFRYIGKLSGNQESWSDTDLSQISVKYAISGVQKSQYDELAAVAGTLTYGLYKAPAPAVTKVAGTKITNASGTTTYSTAADLASRLKAGAVQFQFDTSANDISDLSVTKILVDGTEYSHTATANSNGSSNSDKKTYALSGFTADSAAKVEVYYGDSLVVEYNL